MPWHGRAKRLVHRAMRRKTESANGWQWFEIHPLNQGIQIEIAQCSRMCSKSLSVVSIFSSCAMQSCANGASQGQRPDARIDEKCH